MQSCSTYHFQDVTAEFYPGLWIPHFTTIILFENFVCLGFSFFPDLFQIMDEADRILNMDFEKEVQRLKHIVFLCISNLHCQ